MTDTQQRHLEEISKHIEVLLHASEAPLTASMC
jgi:segregation and condensation protein B